MAEGIKISELEQAKTLQEGCCFPVVSEGENKRITKKDLYDLIKTELLNDIAPIGTILAYSYHKAPKNYLICDGSTFKSEDYPELYELLGSNVLPNLKGRFLQGVDSANNILFGNYIDSRLPNIKGTFNSLLASMAGATTKTTTNASGQVTGMTTTVNSSFDTSGSFTYSKTGSNKQTSSMYGSDTNNPEVKISFDASKFNSIYGDNYNIVQPPAFVIQYIIRAK